ncbi:MAG: HIT domain-containing protein [Deferribacteraceae bacterium]|jgi:ATP adenylyltransferase|nr:HIT domain-containing protein [Deferribacteraceae bacterium]
MLNHIWAPWRGEYVAGWHKDAAGENTQSCVFCAKFAENRDADNLILYRGRSTAIIMNLYPYNNGHIMLLPIRHVADFELLTVDEAAELAACKNFAILALKKALYPDGFNVGMNLGAAAGAGIAEHLHEHIVPRWNGDTNFMPVLNGAKIISEHIHKTYDKIKTCLKKEISV